MWRRHLLLEAVILVLLGLWGWLLVSQLLQPKQRLGVPTRENFDRVEEGRTPKEVGSRLRPPKHQPLGVPTKANFERVREGMTLEEVEAILGPLDTRLVKPGEEEWQTDDAVITIGFSRNHGASKDRRVTYKNDYEFAP